MTERATDAQRRAREAHALEMLGSGLGSATAAQRLADTYGVSLRQARRYVAVASFELCESLTPLELDRLATLSLHRLDLVAGAAMDSGDHDLAIRATKAHAQALAQLRRAITAPQTRFRLPDAVPQHRNDAGEFPDDDLMQPLPF